MPEYAPHIFVQTEMERIRGVILSPEAGMSTDERWEKETDWLKHLLEFDPGCIVDYGCGIGRLSRTIANPVLGVDISATMRHYADGYVDRWDFGSVNPKMFQAIVESGFRASGALSVWTLQHALNPQADISMLSRCLLPGARLVVVNRVNRVVPIMDNGEFRWCDDGVRIEVLLATEFDVMMYRENPDPVFEKGTFIAVYRKRTH